MERFVFNVHFVFQEAKGGFVPEANQIKKFKSDVSSRRIGGRIVQLTQMERCPIYVFKPDANQTTDEVGQVLQCLSESLAPETNCYIIKPTAFYLLTNELLNRLCGKKQFVAPYKATFKKLISGQLPVYLKEVSIG